MKAETSTIKLERAKQYIIYYEFINCLQVLLQFTTGKDHVSKTLSQAHITYDLHQIEPI